MNNTKTSVACTVPGCRKAGVPESMWLPERKAREAANGGQRVELADFPRFALCGYHGHLLRKEEVKVYRYSDEVEREERFALRQEAEKTAFGSFADRFKTKPAGKDPKGPSKPNGVHFHTGPGQGLSRVSRENAEKRSKQETEKAKAGNGADPTPPAPRP